MEKDNRQAQQNSQQIQSIIPDRQHIRKPTDKQSVVKRCFQGRKTCDDSPLAYRRPFAWKGKTFGNARPDGVRRKPLRHLNLKGNVSEPSSLKPVRPGGRLHFSSTKDCSAPRGQGHASPSSVCNGLLIRILFRRLQGNTGTKKSVSSHASRKRIPKINCGNRYFFGVTRECPDISAGCFSPIRFSRVGATSARMPLERLTWSLSSAT